MALPLTLTSVAFERGEAENFPDRRWAPKVIPLKGIRGLGKSGAVMEEQLMPVCIFSLVVCMASKQQESVSKKEEALKDHTANIRWALECTKEFRKISLCFTDYTKAFDGMDHKMLWRVLKDMDEAQYT
ncbi:Low-density lipoprotein receptor-related protein 12 [Varanus komodoensis]|nr:Low-density lipoprotein receptor-related protein 12 [Varanus komodoensis]